MLVTPVPIVTLAGWEQYWNALFPMLVTLRNRDTVRLVQPENKDPLCCDRQAAIGRGW